MLQRYRRDGAYTDCYYMDMPRAVSMAEYIGAFYTSPLFKIERHILALFAGKPSSDSGAKELALGQAERFAAWSVEGRAANQLLLCDFLGRTRSWLMAVPLAQAPSDATRLYFGSAVVPNSRTASGKASFGFAFHALFGFHRLYTRALMRAARSQLAGTAQA
ncbi:MAG: hypothetical protein HZC24_11480 [Rhodocyclales bacterium]|nr:hypothetical protein [Rhodocyclales bacterium]